jgi:tetratricopeptide (TPR) repeat protein
MIAAAQDNPELRLAHQEASCQQAFLNSMKLPPGDQHRQEAISNLALVRWRQLNLSNSESLSRLALAENKPSKSYDRVLVNNMITLAGIYRDQSKFTEAKESYLTVLEYDRRFLTASDPFIGRDLSNLGVNQYIEASSKDRGSERTRLMQQANDYLDQALKLFNKNPKNPQRTSIALSNQYLVLRDLGEAEKAASVKAQADALDAACHRLCKLP